MKKLSLFLLLFGTLSGCEKAENPSIPKRLDLIGGDFSKEWFIRNAAITYLSNGIPKQQSIFLACESDDKWTFYRSGRVVVSDNATKCAGKPAQRLQAFWLPDDTFTAMTFTQWRLTETENKTDVLFEVSNLTDSTMTLTGGAVVANSQKITINYRTL